jgi:hypothetical protein
LSNRADFVSAIGNPSIEVSDPPNMRGIQLLQVRRGHGRHRIAGIPYFNYKVKNYCRISSNFFHKLQNIFVIYYASKKGGKAGRKKQPGI